jgi:hypothetical protein
MIEPTPNRIDYFQRFLPRPYIFSVACTCEVARIESNNLEVALAIRSLCLSSEGREYAPVLEWIVLRDYKATLSGKEVMFIADGALRTLLVGQNTILIFDRSLRKVLGFVGRDVDMRYLTTELIPQLVAE